MFGDNLNWFYDGKQDRPCFRKGRKRQNRLRGGVAHRCALEPLEKRQMMSVTPIAPLSPMNPSDCETEYVEAASQSVGEGDEADIGAIQVQSETEASTGGAASTMLSS